MNYRANFRFYRSMIRASLVVALGVAACSGGDTTPSTTETSGSGGSSSSSSGASSSGAMCSAPPACPGAMPIMAADGKPSGFWSCGDGTTQRIEPTACDPDVGITACNGSESSTLCTSDADCTAQPHGHCGQRTFIGLGGPQTDCTCIYPCANDAECGAGKVCVCGGVTKDHDSAFCADAKCTKCGDCASGVCGASIYPNGCETAVTLACRDAADECHNDADCASKPGTTCVQFDVSSPWKCLGTTCATAHAPPPSQ